MQAQEDQLDILIIEDNPADFFIVEDMLRSSTITVKEIYHASRISEGKAFLQRKKIGLVLLDLSLPDSFGIDSFLQIRALVQHIPVIILTGSTESTVALEALQQGAQDYLVKGDFKTDLLTRAIKYSVERKNAEEKIHASEENYRQMFYKNPFPALIYDLDNLHILEVNETAILKYGYEKEEFLSLTIRDIRPPEEIPAMQLSINNRHKAHTGKDRVWKHKKKNGEIILTEVAFYEINYFGKVAMQAQMNDVTEKHRLEKELEEQRKERQQQITEAIFAAQEEERKLLGAELHDNINQILATAQLYLAACMQDQNPELLRSSREFVVLAIEEIRKLSKSLITPVFIVMGLKQAIEDLSNDIHILKDIEIITELDPLDNPNLGETLKLNIYRMIQEQLNNILKYAEASKVNIQVTASGNNMTLMICDNGKGFDPKKQSKGIGMINIQNRAELFNGTVKIISAPGKGCRLQIELKIKSADSQKAA